jgi:hypothetical protein
VVVVVVAVEDVVLVVVVVGLVVPWELHATDSRPRRTDVAIPVAAAHRRELFITGAFIRRPAVKPAATALGAGVRVAVNPAPAPR